jgi:hypothetical protein
VAAAHVTGVNGHNAVDADTFPSAPGVTPNHRHLRLALHDQVELDRIAGLLNGRPRETLGWMNPAEKMRELLDATIA